MAVTWYCPMCQHPPSIGYCLMNRQRISEVSQSQRPDSSIVDKMGLCYAKYGGGIFYNYFEGKEECIYHKLALGFDKLEEDLARKYGTRIILVSRNKRTTYLIMFNAWSFQPNLLVVGYESSFRKTWSTFYTKEEKVDKHIEKWWWIPNNIWYEVSRGDKDRVYVPRHGLAPNQPDGDTGIKQNDKLVFEKMENKYLGNEKRLYSHHHPHKFWKSRGQF